MTFILNCLVLLLLTMSALTLSAVVNTQCTHDINLNDWTIAGLRLTHSAWSIGTYFSLLIASTLAMLGYGVVRLRKQMKLDGARLKQADIKGGMREFWYEKLPYGLHEMQGALYTHINIILLGFLVSDSDLGVFRSIQLLIVPVSILPSIFSQVQFNQLSQKMGNPTMYLRSFRMFMFGTMGIGVVIYVLYYFLGEPMISWMYNNAFDAELSSTLIVCFTLAFLLKFFSSNYGVLITSEGSQKIRVSVTLLSIILSVSLTLIFAKTLGIVGAAFAMVAANLTILVCYAAYGELVIIKNIKNADSSSRA